MQSYPLQLLLADDDDDDCFLFEEALSEIPVTTQLTTVHNGEQLMQLLTKTTDTLPHLLFLDLNMPRKNGFQCLNEIKQNEKLKNLPVIIFSTSCQDDVAEQLYKEGAMQVKIDGVDGAAGTILIIYFVAHAAQILSGPVRHGFV